jgi:excisionase family DNA binding protein
MRTTQGTASYIGESLARVGDVASGEDLWRDVRHGLARVDIDETVDRYDAAGIKTSYGRLGTRATTGRLVLSIREAAEALGVSDDLVYEMTARGEIPSLQLGRRRVVPLRAIELLIERSLETFDADAVSARLRTGPAAGSLGREDCE